MNFIRKYYLRTGFMLAVIFPAIFVFDRTGNTFTDLGLLFSTFFIFLLILWIFNAVFVDFRKLIREGLFKKWSIVYAYSILSLLLSIPLYFILGWVFRQEDVLFQSLIESNFSFRSWFYIIIRILFFDIGLLVAKFIIDNNKEKQLMKLENEMLKTEQVKATLETFKQQVDPHFLFNSLNTLQSLVKQQDTENTLQFLNELSKVYRYMLIRRDHDYVSLGEEINFLKSYLYLLQIRFGDSFNTILQIDQKHIGSIIPVHTLQLLAENAVKHNIVTIQNPLTLEIFSEEKQLVISNTVLLKKQIRESSGIGLNNINKRYQLLFGKEIGIVTQNGIFKVILPIIE